jgi:hypothetical protein
LGWEYSNFTRAVKPALPPAARSGSTHFGRLWYCGPNAISKAIAYAKFYSRSHNAVIRVYDAAGNVIETHEHKGEFKEP